MGNTIGLQQAQKQQQFLQTQQNVLQSFPQQQSYSYQPSQPVQGFKGNLPQNAYQSFSPQVNFQFQSQPIQYQSASRLKGQPKVEIPQSYQQNNIMLNQPNSRLRFAQSTNQTGLTVTQRSNERRPIINQQNYSYIPQSSGNRGSF